MRLDDEMGEAHSFNAFELIDFAKLRQLLLLGNNGGERAEDELVLGRNRPALAFKQGPCSEIKLRKNAFDYKK